MDLKNKNILITQLRLSDYTGSEIVTLELAEYFLKHAKKIFIATTAYQEPIKKEFEKLKNVVVYDVNEPDLNKALKEEHVEIAWIHHGIIPDALVENPGKTKFIFHHMSPYAEYETPLFPDLEEALASKILCNSQETLNTFIENGLLNKNLPTEVFNNPATSEFDVYVKPGSKLKTVLVVSNHVPEELRKAISILESKGVKVAIFGVQEDEYRRITAEDITAYDVIISIGKTVQYSILARRPVYCYDRFGGPGYLSDENFEKAKGLNFSGRGFDQRSPESIAEEILAGYGTALEFTEELYKKERRTFLLDTRLEELFKNIAVSSGRENVSPSQKMRYKILRDLAFKKQPSIRHIENLEREIKERDGGISILEGRVTDLEAFRFAYEDVLSSSSYRVGRLATLPVRVVKRGYHKTRHKAGLRKNLYKLRRQIKDIYEIGANTASKQQIDIVIRTVHHPTSSTFIRLVSPFAHRDLQQYAHFRLVDGEKAKIRTSADVVIVQRTAIAHLDDARRLVKRVKSNNIKLFVDTDDAFGDLDKDHPQYELQHERVKALDYVIKNADQVWFSTSKLQSRYKAANSKVIRNTLDDKLWRHIRSREVRVPSDDKPLQVLYMGTRTHDGDFALVLPAFRRLYEKYKGEFQLNMIGVASTKEYPWLVTHQPTSGLYPEFVQWFNDLGPFDVGISPLEDTPFNKNKSDIKCLDYLAFGIRPIVSDVEAYRNPELDDLIIRVKNSPDDWYATLEEEIKNRQKHRQQHAAHIKKGYEYIAQYRLCDKAAEEIYDSIK